LHIQHADLAHVNWLTQIFEGIMTVARVRCGTLCGILLPLPPAAAADESAMDAAIIRAQGWTGSLLAPSPTTPGQGVLALEPYIEDKLSAGSFDALGMLHSLPIVNDRYTQYTSAQYGLTDNLAVQVLPAFSATPDGHLELGDLPTRLKYRWFVRGDVGFWHPALTTSLGITFPTGAYQRLASSAEGFGTGAWFGTLQVQMQNFFTIDDHPNRARIWTTIAQPLDAVAVQGISSYGTPASFSGTALPGATAEFGAADEFAIDDHWALALDLAQDFARAAHVHGLGAPSFQSGSDFVVAPGLEYNFAVWIGMIAGVVITPKAHNAGDTVIPQMAVNMFF
jgi:hypothetical protein